MKVSSIENLAMVSTSGSPEAPETRPGPDPGAADQTRQKPSVAVGTTEQLWSMKGPILTIGSIIVFLPLAVSEQREARCAYVVLIMAVLWLTEAIPIPATSLLPIFLFPMCGVDTAKNISSYYVNDTSMLFMGGLIVAVAVEEWKLHKRIAVGVLRMVGSDPKFVMLGLMLPTWFLSMWISNTAAASMMIPIANAVMQQMGTYWKCNGDSQEMKNTNTNADGKPREISTDSGECVDGVWSRVVQDIAGLPDVAPAQPQVTIRVSRPSQVKPRIVVTTVEGKNSDELGESGEFTLLCKGLCLSIAYGCSIGGISTITGTPPNLVLKGMADQLFNDRYKELGMQQVGSGITFGNWMIVAVPLSTVTLFLAWIMLMLLFLRGNVCKRITEEQKEGVRSAIMQEWENLGPFSMAELEITILFAFLIIMWVSRDPKTSPGWSELFKNGYVTDSSTVMVIVILLFLLPAYVPRVFCLRKPEHEKAPLYRPLLRWEQVHRKLPWGVIFLLGGGFAMAQACLESGLTTWLGNKLTGLSSMDSWVLNLVLSLIVSMATEVTNNVATATLLLPVLAKIALTVQVNPLYLMISGGIATSFAYMLPVGTPPNAIVFSYGTLQVFDMAWAGLFLNVISLAVLTVIMNTLAVIVYSLDEFQDIFINATITETKQQTKC